MSSFASCARCRLLRREMSLGWLLATAIGLQLAHLAGIARAEPQTGVRITPTVRQSKFQPSPLSFPDQQQPQVPTPGAIPGGMPPRVEITPMPETVPVPQVVTPPVVAQPELGEEDWLKPLSTISINIRPPSGALPKDIAEPRFAEKETIDFRGAEPWTEVLHAHPVAPFCFRPLYFEDVALERYGMTHGPILQPVISGARFYGTVPALPYLVIARPASVCQYPDYWSDIDKPTIKEHRHAALVEAGVVAGLILLIP